MILCPPSAVLECHAITRERRAPRLGLALALAVTSCAAHAAVVAPDHFTWGAWLGLLWSDNRLRADPPTQNELLFAPSANFSLLHGGTRWRSRGVGELHVERALHDDGEDDLRARIALTADWALLPQHLYWTFQDYATVESIDPLAADSPANRQQTNVFVTGPALLLGHPRSVTARIDARFAHAWAEESPAFNQNRYSLATWLQRRTDPTRLWSAGWETSEVKFRDASADADFQRHDVLLRYDHELPRAGLQIVAGRTWIDVAEGDSFSRPALRATLRLSAGDSHEFRAEVVDELSDAGRDLAAAFDASEPLPSETRRSLIGTDVYRLRSAEAQWLRRGPVSQWALIPFARDYEYVRDAQGLDRRSRGVRLSSTIAITPLLSLHLDAATEAFEFAADSRRDRDSHLTVTAQRRLTPQWSLRAGIGRYLRSSNLAGASYRENTLSLFLIYAGGQ